MKNKKVLPFLISIAATVATVLSCSLIYRFLLTNVGTLVYKSSNYGVKINGKVKQYGKNGDYGEEVECEFELGYTIDKWNDNNTLPVRQDLFTAQKQVFSVNSKYATYQIPILSINSGTNELVLYLSENEKILETDCRLELSRGFLNSKKLSKPDYILKCSKTININNILSDEFVLLSSNVDKTFSRQIAAMETFTLVDNDYSPKYSFVSLYLDNQYCGQYLLTDRSIPSDADFIIMENASNDNNCDFYNNKRSCYVVYNRESKSLDEIQNVVLKSINESNIDYESFSKGNVLNCLFKNSSSSECDIYYYLDKNHTIKYYPIHDFELSAGLWRWSNCDPEGDFITNYWFKKASENIGGKPFNEVVKESCASFLDICSKAVSFSSQFNEALELNTSKWGYESTFGAPDSIIGYYSKESYDQYFLSFSSSRTKWIQEAY